MNVDDGASTDEAERLVRDIFKICCHDVPESRNFASSTLNVDKMCKKLDDESGFLDDFSAWFSGAVDMEGAQAISARDLKVAVEQYLEELRRDQPHADADDAEISDLKATIKELNLQQERLISAMALADEQHKSATDALLTRVMEVESSLREQNSMREHQESITTPHASEANEGQSDVLLNANPNSLGGPNSNPHAQRDGCCFSFPNLF